MISLCSWHCPLPHLLQHWAVVRVWSNLLWTWPKNPWFTCRTGFKGKGKEFIFATYLPCAKIWVRRLSTFACSFNPYISTKKVSYPLWYKWGALHSEIREFAALVQMRVWELAYRVREVVLQNLYYSFSTKYNTSELPNRAASCFHITMDHCFLRDFHKATFQLTHPIISALSSQYSNPTSVLLLCEPFTQ